MTPTLICVALILWASLTPHMILAVITNRDRLTWLIIANHIDCHFKFQNWGRDAKDISGQIGHPEEEEEEMVINRPFLPNCVNY